MTYCQRKNFSAELCSGKSTFIQQIIKKCHFSLTISHEKDTFKIILTYYIYYL